MSDQPAPTQPQGEQPVQIPVELGDVQGSYSNFFRVIGTPEELILDFGLDTRQMTPTGGPEAVKVTQRMVMSFYTAKRLLNALAWAVNRYENNFGVLETDFQKRQRAPQRPPQPPAGFQGS